jgi:hypothetical protein
MRTLLGLILAPMVLMADESTNAPTPVSVTTNYVRAHRSFRRVDGKLYNIEKSVLWSDIIGTCAKVLTNGIVLDTFVEKSEISLVSPPASETSLSNILLGGRSSVPSLEARKWREDGPRIILVNYDGPEPTIGKTIRVKAIKVGDYTYEGGVIGKWDCGTPNVVPVVVTNTPVLQPKAKNRPSSKSPIAK